MNKSNDNIIYSVGEVVWAKIRGYPYWPAIVITNKKIIIIKVSKVYEEKTDDGNFKVSLLVNFIGDNTQ